MKTSILRKALAAILLLCAAGPLHGQEFIRELLNHKDRYSIIREIKEGEWLVSNFHDGEAVFSWVKESSPYADQLYLMNYVGWDSTRVNDFVIFRDTVYFCGTIWFDIGDQAAFWGYFPLAGFPYVTVKYSGSIFETLNQIQVFSVDSSNDLHVVMVGEQKGKERNLGVVVEEMRVTSYLFDENYTYIYEDTNYFTDIIQTDSFFVVSSIIGDVSMHLSDGRILSIAKPIVSHTSIFTGAARWWKVDNITSKILLTECEDDAFVSIYSNRLRTSHYVSGYLNGFLHYATVSLNTLPFTSLMDASYSKDRNTLEVLFQIPINTSGSYGHTEIYQLIPSVVYSTAPVIPIRRYENELLNSLINLSTLRSGYIASGHDFVQKNLRVYRHIDYLWEDCSIYREMEAQKGEFKQEIMNIELTYKTDQVYIFEWENSDKKIQVKKICGE